MLPTPDRRSTTIILLLVTMVAIASAGCTSTSAGAPVGQSGGAEPGSSGSPTTSSVAQPDKSLKDLDMCTLLTPADMPVQPGSGGSADQRPKFDGDFCSTTVQLKDILSVLVSSVERKTLKFSTFVPPSSSPNGRMIEISGRKAWVGSAFSDVSKVCGAVFGAADGSISLSVTDETKRGVDPCQTAVQLAEKVIARTPAPRE